MTAREEVDPELDQTMADAHALQLELTKAQNSHDLEMRKAELGVLGKFFGTGENTSTFIALVSILCCFLGIGITVIMSPEQFQTVLSTFASIITLALGYLFGKKSSQDN